MTALIYSGSLCIRADEIAAIKFKTETLGGEDFYYFEFYWRGIKGIFKGPVKAFQKGRVQAINDYRRVVFEWERANL